MVLRDYGNYCILEIILTFKWNGFADQVDNTFGKGSFKRFSKTYDLQQVYANENIMYKGKKVRLGTILNERLLISNLTKNIIN